MLFNIIEQKVSANLLSILTLATSCQTYRSCFPLFDIDDLEMANCSGGKVWDACGCCRVCAKLCNEKCGGPWNIHGLCDKGLTCIKSLKHGALPFNADGVCKKKTPKKCSLPKVTGPCRAFLRRWYFNTKKGQCEMFVYGGCKGNKNNFKTKKECENACDNECATKAKPKPCPQFCPLNYDPVCGTDGKTEKTYGNTCQLNVAICTTKGKYRFKSKGPCKSKPVTGGGDTCSLPKVTGPCRAYFRRWYFNKKTGRCERFIYGGCRGNKNNFKTKEECQETCGKSAKVCHLLKVSGPCKAYFPRWYYNTESQQCERFIYGGCKGNGNNFKTKRECEDRCTEWCDERRDHHHWQFNRHCERYASRFCTKDCKRCCVHKNDCNPDPRKYVYDFDCGFYDKEPYPQILDSEEYK